MNGDLEKRLSEHIEEGGRFQGKVLQWIDNFDKAVKPELVTKSFCELQRKDDKLGAAAAESLAARTNRRLWANRVWSVIIAVALLVFGHWLGERSGNSVASDETRNVPRSSVESSR